MYNNLLIVAKNFLILYPWEVPVLYLVSANVSANLIIVYENLVTLSRWLINLQGKFTAQKAICQPNSLMQIEGLTRHKK